MATLPPDRGYNDRRLEGIRQANIALAAAKAGQAIPDVDTSLLPQEIFFPDLNARPPLLTPMERFLNDDLHAEPTVIYSRTATIREIEGE